MSTTSPNRMTPPEGTPMPTPLDDVGSIMSPTVGGLRFATLIGQYTNTAAMIMVGWVLYQTIGVELPAMREQTYVRTQAIITTMERMRESMDGNGRAVHETYELNKEMMRMHQEQVKVLSELTREIRDLRAKRIDGD